jgi:hypothetical protein
MLEVSNGQDKRRPGAAIGHSVLRESFRRRSESERALAVLANEHNAVSRHNEDSSDLAIQMTETVDEPNVAESCRKIDPVSERHQTAVIPD